MSAADKAVRFDHPPRHAEYQSDGRVRRVLGQFIRRVGDGNSAGRRRFQVDLIEAHATRRDQLEIRQSVHQGRACTRVNHGYGDREPGSNRKGANRTCIRRIVDDVIFGGKRAAKVGRDLSDDESAWHRRVRHRIGYFAGTARNG